MLDSRFPGTDPFVESPVHWKDFHFRFISDLSDAIAERLQENYVARVEEDVLMLAHEGQREQLVEPDLAIVRTAPGQLPALDGRAGDTLVLEATTVANIRTLDPHTEGALEIRRLPDRDLVIVVVLLSRTNKSGEGRGLCLEKWSVCSSNRLGSLGSICSGAALSRVGPVNSAVALLHIRFASRASSALRVMRVHCS